MFEKITKYIYIPKLYESSTDKFLDDDHISKGMLKEHLNSDSDFAIRDPKFVQSPVDWISSQALCTFSA